MKPRSRGQSIIELVVGLVAMIPIILALIDFIAIVTCIQANDAACRDACRAAAAGPPTQIDATKRINAVLQQVYHGGGLLQGSPYISDDASYPLFSPTTPVDPGPCGGLYQGSILLETKWSLQLPVPFGPWGTLTPRSKQQFPITYVKPPDPNQCPTPN